MEVTEFSCVNGNCYVRDEAGQTKSISSDKFSELKSALYKKYPMFEKTLNAARIKLLDSKVTDDDGNIDSFIKSAQNIATEVSSNDILCESNKSAIGEKNKILQAAVENTRKSVSLKTLFPTDSSSSVNSSRSVVAE